MPRKRSQPRGTPTISTVIKTQLRSVDLIADVGVEPEARSLEAVNWRKELAARGDVTARYRAGRKKTATGSKLWS